MDGFDITLLTNRSLLVPAYVSLNTVDLTGSVINTAVTGPAFVVSLCVNGQLVSGSTCVNPDRTDTIHFAATGALGAPLTTAPTSGLLFTALFNITGKSSGSQPVGFQTPVNDKNGNALPECRSQVSVVGYCITIANGTPTPVPETVQAATFNNSGSSTMPFVTLSANATSFGPEFPGVANHVNVTANVMNGYSINSTNSVSFTTIATPGLTVSPASGSCTAQPCSIVLTLNPSGAGNYSLTVAGTYISKDASGNPDTLVSTVGFFVMAYDFGFAINPLTLSFISGEIGSATATISSQNGFSGVIVLSTNLVIPVGMTIAYYPSTISLASGQSLTSTITFKASPTIMTTYHAKVNAAYPGRVKTSLLLTITANAPVPDFYFFATPQTIGPVDAGVSGSANVIVGYANGFANTVNLSVSPANLGSLNRTSVSTSHNVTLTASASVANNYSVTVTGTDGTITHTITFTLIVVDFNLTAAPNPISVGQGSSKLTSISVIALNGFTGSVSLTIVQSPGLSAQLVPNLIVGSGNALLNVTAAAGMAIGQYTVNVTGTSSPLHHMVQVNVTVVQNNFQIQAAPVSLSAYPGQSVNSVITLTSLFGFAGAITLSVVAPAQVTATLNPTSVTLSRGGSGTAILTVSTSLSGTFAVNVTGVNGALKHFTLLSFRSNTDVSFSITLPISQVTLSEGSTGTVPVTITSENGFTGTITFGYTVVKPSTGLAGVGVPNATLRPSTLMLSPNASQNITVVVTVQNNVVSQIFGINVTGTSGSLVIVSGTMTLIVPPPGFSIVPSPSTVTVGPGVRGNATVTLTAVDGLFGSVSLSLVVSNGVTCSITRASVVLKRDGSNTTSLSCTGPIGQNSVQIVGSGTTPYGGGISQTGALSFVVASFALSSTPTGVLVNTGQQGNAKITVSWTNSYNGKVSLQLTPVSGLTASLDSPTLSGSGSTMVHVSSSTAGTYSLVVTATSGPDSQTLTLTVTVSQVTQAGVDPLILYSGIGVGVVAVGAAGFLLSRRRGKQSRTK
jgi:hypothetical protein